MGEPTCDLIKFLSPNRSRESTEIAKIDVISPGNNPFDSLSNVCQNTTSKCPSISNSVNILDIAFTEGASFKFSTLNISDVGKESLGILQIEAMNASFKAAEDFSELDCGRESLGVLNFKRSIPDLDIYKCTEGNLQNAVDNSCAPPSEGLLHPLYQIKANFTPSYRSFLKSLDSRSSTASEPSNIYSICALENFLDSNPSSKALNVALGGTNIEKYLEESSLNKELVERGNKFRKTLTSDGAILELGDVERKVPGRSVSVGLLDLGLKEEIIEEVNEDEENKKGEALEDSVFMEVEAHHMASKIADGSILEESPEMNVLDQTPQPEELEFEQEVVENIKPDTETVFKMIDKMLPPPNHQEKSIDDKNSDLEIDSSKNSQNNLEHSKRSNSSPKDCDPKEVLQNLSAILTSGTMDERQRSQGQSLLNSLASIICSERNSKDSKALDDSGHSSIENDQEPEEQQIECYEVLDLRTKVSSSGDDSKPIDLSMGAKNFENSLPKTSQSLRQLPSMRSSTSSLEMSKNSSLQNSLMRRASESNKEQYLISSSLESSKNQSNRTGSSNDSRNFSGSGFFKGPLLGKLKIKKADSKSATVKAGPMKAIVKLEGLSGSKDKTANVSTTPSKKEHQAKKTSTPINQKHGLKPIAQSTPDAIKPTLNRSMSLGCQSDLKKGKFDVPLSPLTETGRRGNFSKTITSTNGMGSAPNIVGPNKSSASVIPSLKQSVTYRNSASDVRRVQEDTQQMRRSSSLGKEIGKGLKVDRSISEKFGLRPRASSISLPKKVNPVAEKSGQRKTLGENVNNVSFSGKSSNLFSKLKRSIGKENTHH